MGRSKEELRRLLGDDDEQPFYPSSDNQPESAVKKQPIKRHDSAGHGIQKEKWRNVNGLCSSRSASPDSLYHQNHGPQPPSPSPFLAAAPARTRPTGRKSPYFDSAVEDVLVREDDEDDSEWLEGFDPDAKEGGAAKPKNAEDEYGHTSPDIEVDEPVVTPEVLEQRKKDEEALKLKRHHNPNDPSQIPLVNYSEIPEMYRSIFTFPIFNAVQSKVYPIAYKSRENLVVSSPTGSGKTTIFDMAFLRMLHEEGYAGDALAVYMAPTKALCTERARDWRQRMQHLDIHCIEFTGDTGGAYQVLKTLQTAKLIVTTPEKWDALTRRTGQISRLLARLSLVMIDEVHFIRENRGATLEVVVSRIKALGTGVRFVALSATVPNIDDIARWLGPQPEETEPTGIYEGKEQEKTTSHVAIKDMPKAKVFQFGEEFRPVKLKKEIYGFDCNEWVLNARLDKELFPILVKHSEAQPVLIFCPTRKSCQVTAEEIWKQYGAAQEKGQRLPWIVRGKPHDYKDPKLRDMARSGIAFHHAGLDVSDRRDVEANFLGGSLSVIVSTSTLAVGVNLPAHLIVIKGTAAYNGPATGFREYSDIDIQQMMGRAGRPQFGKTGTCVIMCESSKQAKYRSMMNSQTILESSLHENLTEHINSEIGLSTIRSLQSAQNWLKSSFLFIRIQQNPRHYGRELSKDRDKTWEQTLDHYVEESLRKLETHELVEHPILADEEENRAREGLIQTEYGRAMSNNVISFTSMVQIMKMKPNATLRQLLEMLAGSKEFVDLRIRPGEHQMLNQLRRHIDVRYQIGEQVEDYADKVFLYLQVCFANIRLDESKSKSENLSLQGTLMAIFREAPRIAKTIANVAQQRACTNPDFGGALRSALQLLHIISGKAWEDSSTVFRQLDAVGPRSILKMDEQGIKTFDDLINADVGALAASLLRNPVFAMNVIEAAKAMPRYTMTLEKEAIDFTGRYPRLTLRATVIEKGIMPSVGTKAKKKASRNYYVLSILFLKSDDTLVDYRRLEVRKIKDSMRSFHIDVTLKSSTDKVVAHIGVDEVSGCASVVEYDPKLDEDVFPTDPTDDEAEEVITEPRPTAREPDKAAEPHGQATTKAVKRVRSPSVEPSEPSKKTRSSNSKSETAAPMVQPNLSGKPRHGKTDSQQETTTSEKISTKPHPTRLPTQPKTKTADGPTHTIAKPKKRGRSNSPLFLPHSSDPTQSDKDNSDEDTVERIDVTEYRREQHARKKEERKKRKRLEAQCRPSPEPDKLHITDLDSGDEGLDNRGSNKTKIGAVDSGRKIADPQGGRRHPVEPAVKPNRQSPSSSDEFAGIEMASSDTAILEEVDIFRGIEENPDIEMSDNQPNPHIHAPLQWALETDDFEPDFTAEQQSEPVDPTQSQVAEVAHQSDFATSDAVDGQEGRLGNGFADQYGIQTEDQEEAEQYPAEDFDQYSTPNGHYHEQQHEYQEQRDDLPNDYDSQSYYEDEQMQVTPRDSAQAEPSFNTPARSHRRVRFDDGEIQPFQADQHSPGERNDMYVDERDSADPFEQDEYHGLGANGYISEWLVNGSEGDYRSDEYAESNDHHIDDIYADDDALGYEEALDYETGQDAYEDEQRGDTAIRGDPLDDDFDFPFVPQANGSTAQRTADLLAAL